MRGAMGSVDFVWGHTHTHTHIHPHTSCDFFLHPSSLRPNPQPPQPTVLSDRGPGVYWLRYVRGIVLFESERRVGETMAGWGQRGGGGPRTVDRCLQHQL